MQPLSVSSLAHRSIRPLQYLAKTLTTNKPRCSSWLIRWQIIEPHFPLRLTNLSAARPLLLAVRITRISCTLPLPLAGCRPGGPDQTKYKPGRTRLIVPSHHRPGQTQTRGHRRDQKTPGHQTRPDQTRPEQTRPDQTGPDGTGPARTGPTKPTRPTRPHQARPERSSHQASFPGIARYKMMTACVQTKTHGVPVAGPPCLANLPQAAVDLGGKHCR